MRLAVALLAISLSGCAGSQDPRIDQGRVLATERGCVSCHTSDGSDGVGPTWKGLYMSQVPLSDGVTVTADDAYLRRSITDPSADTVDGFPAGAMERVIRPGSLTDDEVEALIAYIKSLR